MKIINFEAPDAQKTKEEIIEAVKEAKKGIFITLDGQRPYWHPLNITIFEMLGTLEALKAFLFEQLTRDEE
jgi:hypothetical protein